MPVAVFRFRRAFGVRRSRTRLEGAASALLGAILKNGQVEGDWFLAWSGATLTARCTMPAADALDDRYATHWVREELQAAERAFARPPSIAIEGEHDPVQAPAWKSAGSLVLFTQAFDSASPVCCGRTRRPIPPYALPLDPTEREHLVFWAEAYRHTDSLWIDGGVLERAIYRQLADPRSSLLRRGRRLAALLERRTSLPTYVFVMRYHGRRAGEGRRRCPGCGGAWRRRGRRGHLPAWWFPFVCPRCRLASQIGPDITEPMLSKIGEFRVRSSGATGGGRRLTRTLSLLQ